MAIQLSHNPHKPNRNFFIPEDLEELLKFAANEFAPFLIPGLTQFNGRSNFEISIVNRTKPSKILIILASANVGGISYDVRLESLTCTPPNSLEVERVERMTKAQVVEEIRVFARRS